MKDLRPDRSPPRSALPSVLACDGGGHGFAGGGGGHAFVGGGGHAFGGSRSFSGFSRGLSGRGISSAFSGTGGISGRGSFGLRDGGHFGDRGFRGRDRDFRERRFRDFAGDPFDFGFFGFGYPDYYTYNYPYPDDYAYPYYNSDAYLGAEPPVYYGRSGSGEASFVVQTALSRRGYYLGPIDGVIGAGSRRAIRAFQSDRGLPVTGLIDRKLLVALQRG